MNKVSDLNIYLDNAATTKVHPQVLKSFNEVTNNYFANTSSIHKLGQKSSNLLSKAREKMTLLMGLKDHTCVFLSGATEANNLALKGYCLKHHNRGNHIIVSNIEHPSILETARQLEEKYGFEVTYLPVNADGIVTLESLKSAIRKDTILVSLMAVNNEIGSVNPIEDIANYLIKFPKIAFHVDAVQAIGKVNINFNNVDMITIAGHKIHCLKGVGALFVRKTISLEPNNNGGGQENGIRSGTNDLAGAVALSKALRLAATDMDNRRKHVYELASTLVGYLNKNRDLYELNSNIEANPYVINFSLVTKKASVLVEALSNDGIMVSSTSACHSKGEKGSYVVAALGKEPQLAQNTVRVSLDESNTLDEIKILIEYLDKNIKGIRQK